MTLICSPAIPDVGVVLPEFLELLTIDDPAAAGFLNEHDSRTWVRPGEYDVRLTLKDWGWRELRASCYDHHVTLSCNDKGHDVRTLSLSNLSGTLRQTPGRPATFHFVYCPEPGVSYAVNQMRDGTLTCIDGGETITRTGAGAYLRGERSMTQGEIDAEYGSDFPFASDFPLRSTIADMVSALQG